MMGNPGGGGDPVAAESGGSSGGDGGPPMESGGGGNRWPRQETVALIKIRTDMDVAFRDSSLKGPLWDEVSRKLAELGYHRSAKKCKEKFENVFKYHKRTKDGRGTKSEGKTYRFFDQLEALDTQITPPPRPQTHQPATPATPLSIAMPVTNPSIAPPYITSNNNTVPSTQSVPQFQNPITIPQTNSYPPNTLPPQTNPFSISFSAPVPPYKQNPTPVSSSSSTSSDEETEQTGKRKRKWADFFRKLTDQVMEKQEEMQRKFLEALERRERDRVAREEAWRAQEASRMAREREILAQERAVAAAKDTAVFAFLQKVSASDQQTSTPSNLQPTPTPPPPPPQQQMLQPPVVTVTTPAPVQQTTPQPPPPQQAPQLAVSKPVLPPPSQPPPSQLDLQMQPSAHSTRNEPNADNGGEIVNYKYPNPSSSRWPKAEIEALIKLRTNLDVKYQENVPKGPLWEDISAAMLRLGYNRNAKRCKEKWENINKYYKKVKESNKKRPEDSKTCPYFSQLEAIYKERAKSETHFTQENVGPPIMAQPEQQWPVQNRQELPLMEGQDSDDDMDDDEDEDDEPGNNYELVPNKPSAVGAVE